MTSTQGEQGARTYTRRQFMEYRRIMDGAPLLAARQAVASWALKNPDWDLDEELTWAQWAEWEDHDQPRDGPPPDLSSVT